MNSATFNSLRAAIVHEIVQLSWPSMCGVNKSSQIEWDAIKAKKELRLQQLLDSIAAEQKERDRTLRRKPGPLCHYDGFTLRSLARQLSLGGVRGLSSMEKQMEAMKYTGRRRELKALAKELETRLSRIVYIPRAASSAAKKYIKSVPLRDNDFTSEERGRELVDLVKAECKASIANLSAFPSASEQELPRKLDVACKEVYASFCRRLAGSHII
eukprot:jgi/Mesvir1/14588/Mv26245-RA.1